MAVDIAGGKTWLGDKVLPLPFWPHPLSDGFDTPERNGPEKELRDAIGLFGFDSMFLGDAGDGL